MIRSTLLMAGLMLLAPVGQASAKIEEVKTASGYTVWLSEDHTLPIVTAVLSFERSGSAYDPAGKEGLASFLTQMLDEGSADMDSLTFHQALEKRAIRYGATAGEDTITLSMQTLTEHKNAALTLLLQTVTKPRFDTEAVERIRASIVSDLTQLEEEPDYLASRRWKELAFPAQPYSHPRRGTIASVKALTADDLRLFAAHHFFAGQPPIIAVTGDITAEEIRKWPLPALAAPATPPMNLSEVALPDGKEPVLVPHDAPQTVVIASLPAIKRNDPRYYSLQVLNHIVGGSSITSRLGAEVRNKRGLAYHIGSSIEEMDHAAFLSVNFATRDAQAKEAVAVFTAVLKELSEKGVTEQEVLDAKHYLTGSFPLEHDTQAELAGFLIGIQRFHLGIHYPEQRNTLIDKVSLTEVNALAKELLSHPPLIVMTGRGTASPSR